jgi:hypothetical protein
MAVSPRLSSGVVQVFRRRVEFFRREFRSSGRELNDEAAQ